MKFKYAWLALILVALLILGVVIPKAVSKSHNFVGKVGRHIYVDSSADKEVVVKDLEILWHGLYRGAPEFALQFGWLITQRIEIVSASVDRVNECGLFAINLYTIFNMKYLETRVRYHCA